MLSKDVSHVDYFGLVSFLHHPDQISIEIPLLLLKSVQTMSKISNNKGMQAFNACSGSNDRALKSLIIA